MEKLKMHTPDLAEENYKKLAALFPVRSWQLSFRMLLQRQ